MPESGKKFKITVVVSGEIMGKINFLKAVSGIHKFADLFNFAMSLTQMMINGVIAGKKIAFYDEKTDEIEIITHERLDQIAALRKEG